jgi:hypothetical protein
VINAVEEFLHIAFPNVSPWKTTQKFLYSFNRPKQTLTDSTRPRIVDKGFIIDWNEVIVHETMDNSVADRGDGNFAALVVAHDKLFIPAVSVFAIIQITIKIKQIFLQKILEFMEFCSLALTFTEGKPAVPDIF